MNLLVCDYDNTIFIHKNVKASFKKVKFLKNKKSLENIKKVITY